MNLNSEQTNLWNNLLKAAVDFPSLEVLNSTLDLSLLKRKKKKDKIKTLWFLDMESKRPMPCVRHAILDNH